VGGDFLERAFGTGDDLVGAQAFQNFGEFVQVATDNDISLLVAVAGAFGYQQSGLDVVGGHDDKMSVIHAGVYKRALLFRIIHDDGLARAKEIIHSQGIFLDQDIGQLALAKVLDQPASEMSATDDDDMVFHFTGKHAASLLRIVTLQGLKNKNGNDDPEQNTLSPERIEFGERSRMNTEIERAKQSLAQGQMVPMPKCNGPQGEPQKKQPETPAALPEEEGQSNPEEAAHRLLPRTRRSQSGLNPKAVRKDSIFHAVSPGSMVHEAVQWRNPELVQAKSAWVKAQPK